MGARSVYKVVLALVLVALCAVAGYAGSSADPTTSPPVFPDPYTANGTLTFLLRNYYTKAVIYYSYQDKGKILVNQDLGGDASQHYLGNRTSSPFGTATNYFYATDGSRTTMCVGFESQFSIPGPDMFKDAVFEGRVEIHGITTQRWRSVWGRPVFLFVTDDSHARPVRIEDRTFRFDFHSIVPYITAPDSIWNVPRQCSRRDPDRVAETLDYLQTKFGL